MRGRLRCLPRLRQALLAPLAWDEAPHALAPADIAERADLAEADLVAHYGSVDGCLAATYDELSEELYELHLHAFDESGDWQSRFLDGMRAALDRIDSTPGATRLFFADDLLGHPRLRTRRAAAQQRVARLVAEEVEHERERGCRPSRSSSSSGRSPMPPRPRCPPGWSRPASPRASARR